MRQRTDLGRATPRVPFLDNPPLGHLQAIVLKLFDELDEDAFGYGVVAALQKEIEASKHGRGRIADSPQVYACVRKLEQAGFIKFRKKRKSPIGGPPVRLYDVTAAGREAINVTAEHHRSLADFLARDRRVPRRT